jgi:hypothetical protein
MRVFAAAVLAALCLATMAGCSHTKQPPAGRWVGSYDTDDTMIVARLEIAANGTIFLSAPDALNIGAVSADQRAAMRDRLAAGLASSWATSNPARWISTDTCSANPAASPRRWNGTPTPGG